MRPIERIRWAWLLGAASVCALALFLLGGTGADASHSPQAAVQKASPPPRTAVGTPIPTPPVPAERVVAPGAEVSPEDRLPDDESAPLADHEKCGEAISTGGELPDPATPIDGSSRVTFAVKFQDEVSPFRLISAFVLPDEPLDLEAVLTDPAARFGAYADTGRLETLGPRDWRWHPPGKHGIYCIRITDLDSGETICIHAFVMLPYHGEEVVNGYRIGRYERLPLRNDPAYAMPRGLVEITRENENSWVSPRLQLRQFACKQQSDYPKYAVIRTRMLLKLETVLDELNAAGIEADSFFVMSGYRTPYYNAAIGNRTRYSRHAYGDAADVFIDVDRNGRMDDIDRDGRITRDDARAVARVVESLTRLSWYRPLVGGMAAYGPAPHRGPFVHLDTRGSRARW